MTARPLPEAVSIEVVVSADKAWRNGTKHTVVMNGVPLGASFDGEAASLACDVARAAIAAAMAPGEPVAWAVYSADNILATCGPSREGCENYAAGLNEPGWTAKKGIRPFRVEPLFSASSAGRALQADLDTAREELAAYRRCEESLRKLVSGEGDGYPVAGHLATVRDEIVSLREKCAAAPPAPPVAESVRDALAKVDVEVTDRRDDGTSVISVLGLKEVEAAHRAEVERAVREAVEQEREACLSSCKSVIDAINHDGECPMLVVHAYEVHGAEKCMAAIRARGGA